MALQLPDMTPILGWYRENARDLPWRHTRDPYRIWVSEIMLQQTRVEAVIPYYRRFLAAFPTVEALAAAEEAERQAKIDEKRRKEEARLERAKRIEEEKLNKKKGIKKPESSEPGINKDDSREGLRAYARGRAYMPDRFGGVTPYTDPNELLKAEAEAEAAKKKKSSKKDKEEK